MEEVLNTSVTRKHSAETCGYWLLKRKRYCRTKPIDGLEFCPSHISKASEDIVNTAENFLTTSNDTISTIIRNDSTEIPIDDADVLTESTKPLSDLLPVSTKQQNCSKSRDSVADRPVPSPDRCHFWLERKRRYCKSRLSGIQLYCVEHSVGTAYDSCRNRISCPNDPKHSCYVDQLERHLKKCNARLDLRPVYFTKGINAGELKDEVAAELRVGIHDIDILELNTIVELVNALHNEHVTIVPSVLSHKVLKQEIEKPSNGPAANKHLQQKSSLIGNLELLGLLKNFCNYLEFGAGKGGLSHWVQLANGTNVNTKYLLIDRSSVRYKKDVYHKGENQGPNFERLKIDIEDLDLNKVESLSSSSSNTWPLVGIGKHLCGAATDLMLRCLIKTHTDHLPNTHCKVDGLLVALCCHHRCSWKAYVGKEWFYENGLGPRHFSLFTSMSAWATCGMKHVNGGDAINELNDESHDLTVDSTSYNHPRYGKLLPEERENIGFKCKQLIDRGRLHYLITHGYDSKLLYYADSMLTLENTALAAVRTTDMN